VEAALAGLNCPHSDNETVRKARKADVVFDSETRCLASLLTSSVSSQGGRLGHARDNGIVTFQLPSSAPFSVYCTGGGLCSN
jgi:hypothetical protein